MNRTTSKCGSWCRYYYNGLCAKADGCVDNYNERPDENNIINIDYNPASERVDYSAVDGKYFLDKVNISPKTIYIDCQEIYLTKGALEIKIDLTELDFNDIGEIIINGIKFKKE